MDNTTPNPLNTGNGQVTPTEPVSSFKLEQNTAPTVEPRQITNDELQKSASVDLQVAPAQPTMVAPVETAPVVTVQPTMPVEPTPVVEPTPPTPPVTAVDPDQKLASELQNIDEPKSGFMGFLQNPVMKKYFMIGGAALIFIAIVVGVYFTFFSGDSEVVADELTTEENGLGNSLSGTDMTEEVADQDAERLENVVNELKELNETENSDNPPGMSIVIDEDAETNSAVDSSNNSESAVEDSEETPPAKVMR
ncbi:MAG: hypothetical protein AAB373_02115 [Patescibacteria group bacterium]|mgnify:CR=1 FL=1